MKIYIAPIKVYYSGGRSAADHSTNENGSFEVSVQAWTNIILQQTLKTMHFHSSVPGCYFI